MKWLQHLRWRVLFPQAGPRWLAGFLLMVVGVTLVTGLGLHGSAAESGGDYSPAFLILLYINLFLLVALGFLVFRNLARLWLDRRNRAAGSALRTRMVSLFVLLSLLPTLVVAILSVELLNRGVDSWFSDRIHQALTHSLEVARAYYRESQQTVRHDAEDLVRNRTIASGITLQDSEAVTAALEVERQARGLDQIAIVRADGAMIVSAGVLPPDRMPELTILVGAPNRALLVTNDTGERVRAFIRLSSDLYLFTGRWIDRQILAQMETIELAFKNYNQLRAAHGVLKDSHTVTLVLISLLLVLAAVWSGFRIAGQITDPITELVVGTRKVASGDLSVTLPVTGDDELATLQAAFNAMTLRLTENQRELHATNALLEERRRFMAAILRNISSGVISVNRFDEITLMNPVAGELLGLELADAIGHPFAEALPSPVVEPLQELLANASPSRARGPSGPDGGNLYSTQIQLPGPEGTVTLLTRMTLLENQPEEGRGFIVTFDDLTDVLQAQRNLAWSDVARRIAHEIKNPLTPIQLWAQRLQRKYLRAADAAAPPDWRVLEEGTHAIINQVGEMRVLVDEFSNFARMPRPDLKNDSLDDTIREVLLLHGAERGLIRPQTDFSGDLPPFPFDRGQIKQVITNLVANAAAAIKERGEADAAQGESATGAEAPHRLVISTALSENGQWARVVVADSGPGIPAADRTRVWEPYFTTKKKGTGLGLAIVKKIIEDHGGTLRLRDSDLGGAQVEFQLPISGPGRPPAAETAAPTSAEPS